MVILVGFHPAIRSVQSTPADNSRGGGGGGGTQKFSYIPRLGSIFGLEFLNFNIFWGFQKKNTFLGYEDFMDFFFGVITKLDFI